MSVSYIPENVKIRLWGKAAGRCQYAGCNAQLGIDPCTKAEFNAAYIAHIVADKPDGPRGDLVLSEQLKDNIANLMLLCDRHHRLVDSADIPGHPTPRLQEMKRTHEARIELVTSIGQDRQSHVVLYGANVGQHSSPVSWERTTPAMLPERYPAGKPAIELSLRNSTFQDDEPDYWSIERRNLQRQFAEQVRPRLASVAMQHLSVFAMAPQPLLIELGRLLSDIPAADVYQLHREPPDWKWQDAPAGFGFALHRPEQSGGRVALKLSLSDDIVDSRITAVLGSDVAIWCLTVPTPDKDFLKGCQQLSDFRREFRQVLGLIKAQHSDANMLHLFPAVPVAIAVEIGRVWMPKADLPLRIYDQNSKLGGFVPVYDIASE